MSSRKNRITCKDHVKNNFLIIREHRLRLENKSNVRSQTAAAEIAKYLKQYLVSHYYIVRLTPMSFIELKFFQKKTSNEM